MSLANKSLTKKGKLMNNCFLCMDADGGNPVTAVQYSPFGYAVCESHYRSDFNEFVRDGDYA